MVEGQALVLDGESVQYLTLLVSRHTNCCCDGWIFLFVDFSLIAPNQIPRSNLMSHQSAERKKNKTEREERS